MSGSVGTGTCRRPFARGARPRWRSGSRPVLRSGPGGFSPSMREADDSGGQRGRIGMSGALKVPERRFQLVLIKPSHYDDDGYVIQWARAFVPSNTLAVLYSLARDSAQRAALGPNVAIDITVIDEIHSRVKVERLIALIRRHGGVGPVGPLGVPSNQFSPPPPIAPPVPAARLPPVLARG